MAVSKAKKKAETTEATKVIETVQNLDIQTVVKDMGDLQLQVQQGLANLGAALTKKVQSLEEVEQAIKLREQRLQDLYEVEAEVVSLQELREQRERDEQEAKRSQDEARARWMEEARERDKKWKREQEEHEYENKIRRDRFTTEHQELVDSMKRQERIRQEQFERNWQDREAALTAREQEVEELKKVVAGIDARIKNEVSRAEAIVTNSLKKHHDFELQMIRKDAETASSIHTSEVANYKNAIATLQDQVRDLNTQLVAARADAKDVAQEALRSASGRQATDALQAALSNNMVGSNKTK